MPNQNALKLCFPQNLFFNKKHLIQKYIKINESYIVNIIYLISTTFENELFHEV